MLLEELISDLPLVSISGGTHIDIKAVCYDSRRISQPQTLFVAISGSTTDGNNYVEDAFSAGSVVVADCTDAIKLNGDERNRTLIVTKDTRAALATVAAKFYGYPTRNIEVVGITGTNGKTTTTFIVQHICNSVSRSCGLIGTIGYDLGDGKMQASERTTPESLDLQARFAMMRDRGTTAACIEVSSHAVYLKRIQETEFDAAVFTNLTQDHLDFHKDLASYFEAKCQFFTSHLPAQKTKRGVSIINIDDAYGCRICERLGSDARVVTYGKHPKADFRFEVLSLDFVGTVFQLTHRNHNYLVRSPLIGQFNVYNAVAAISSCSILGIDVGAAIECIANLEPIKGRLQRIRTTTDFHVFVDYAHTEDALRNVLESLRMLKPQRLIVVFGCGGDRDQSKRPKMGSVAEQLADLVIVTSDNPRTEDPLSIIDDISRGMTTGKAAIRVDRAEAIAYALGLARVGDVVLIAGKGHENTQHFAHQTIDFDDAETAQRVLMQSHHR